MLQWGKLSSMLFLLSWGDRGQSLERLQWWEFIDESNGQQVVIENESLNSLYGVFFKVFVEF